MPKIHYNPRADDDLAFLSSTEVLRLYSNKQVSPSEYLEMLFARIEEDNQREKPINAFVDILYEEARKESRKADDFYASGGSPDGGNALRGLPIAVKESHPVQGGSSTNGIIANSGIRASTSHILVDRLNKVGGIVHARTTTPQLSCIPMTHSKMWGVTRAPWNRDKTPGGSSGGSGAALAAGFAPLATASDIGGSTRIPAGFNGVVGYKSPYGIVPAIGAIAADWYRSDGTMARSVSDVALSMNVIRGIHPSDHNSVPSQPISMPGPEQAVDGLSNMKILYCPTLGNFPVERSVRSQLDRAAKTFGQAGANVEEIQLPWDNYEIWRTTMAHTGHMFGQSMRKALEDKEDSAEDYVLRNIEDGIRLASEISMLEVLESERRIQRQLAEVLQGADALITPVSGIRSLDADYSYLDGITSADQPDGVIEHIYRVMMAIMTKPFNISNRCPVLSIPAGFDHGFPIGMQIVGNAYSEQDVFNVAAGYEQICPWAHHHPALD